LFYSKDCEAPVALIEAVDILSIRNNRPVPGLVPEGKTAQLIKSLVQDINTKKDGFMQTGIFGLGRIFPSLAENGAEEQAFKMLTKTGKYSFAYCGISSMRPLFGKFCQ
jgi:hypothetical protein